jgi:hypothetical protein
MAIVSGCGTTRARNRNRSQQLLYPKIRAHYEQREAEGRERARTLIPQHVVHSQLSPSDRRH